MTEKREITGVRSAPAHKENPFLNGSLVTVKGRKKNYTVASDAMTLTDSRGQVQGTVQHTITRVVDDTQFVKVFSDGVAGMYDLGRPGAKVFRFLFDEVQKNPNQDRIYLYFMDALEDPWRIPKTTFFKGLAELLEKGFLAKSANPNMFFLNPSMMWNGDRFRFVQEYQRASLAARIAARSDLDEMHHQEQLRLNCIDQETGEILA
jgi:hypothetical protein